MYGSGGFPVGTTHGGRVAQPPYTVSMPIVMGHNNNPVGPTSMSTPSTMISNNINMHPTHIMNNPPNSAPINSNSNSIVNNNGQIPQFFPELCRISTAQAEILLNNPLELDTFFESLEYVKGVRQSRTNQRDNVEKLAVNNLSHEKEINDLKNTVSGLQLNIREKYKIIESKVQRQQAVLSQYSTDGVKDGLKKGSEEAERESDEIAERFKSGGVNTNDFIKDYMAKRKLHHLRAAKYEYFQIHN